MMQLNYEGYFQCRLATDPDPTDEKRGIAGPTFSVAGEPYLDRIIRLQNPVAIRFPRQDDFGVTVRAVQINDQPIPDHPLLGAGVELLDGAKFHSLNFIVSDTADTPIAPFHLRITADDLVLQREDLLDLADPHLSIYDATPEQVKRRQPVGMEMNSPEVAEATGIMNYEEYRVERMHTLEAMRAHAQTEEEDAALERRIIELGKINMAASKAATLFLGFKETFALDINGPATIHDPHNKLCGVIGTSQTWNIKFWFGGYDTDTLCGYMRGTLQLPFLPDAG